MAAALTLHAGGLYVLLVGRTRRVDGELRGGELTALALGYVLDLQRAGRWVVRVYFDPASRRPREVQYLGPREEPPPVVKRAARVERRLDDARAILAAARYADLPPRLGRRARTAPVIDVDLDVDLDAPPSSLGVLLDDWRASAPWLRSPRGSAAQVPVGTVMRRRSEGQSYRKIAAALGVPTGSVKSTISRARPRPTKELEDDHEAVDHEESWWELAADDDDAGEELPPEGRRMVVDI